MAFIASVFNPEDGGDFVFIRHAIDRTECLEAEALTPSAKF
jgi:hypothetical protein